MSDEEQRYEVEEVVAKRRYKGRLQYLLKWKDYGDDENTWCDKSSCACPDLIKKFEDSQKDQKTPTMTPTSSKSAAKSSAKTQRPGSANSGSTGKERTPVRGERKENAANRSGEISTTPSRKRASNSTGESKVSSSSKTPKKYPEGYQIQNGAVVEKVVGVNKEKGALRMVVAYDEDSCPIKEGPFMEILPSRMVMDLAPDAFHEFVEEQFLRVV